MTKPIKSTPCLRKMPESEGEGFIAILNLVRYLRGPQGCPWDRKQTAANFAGYVREEALELIEALKTGDAECISEEWGDTLFTLLAVAAAAEQEGVLEVGDALRGAHEKLIRRHAHIFGAREAETPEEVAEMWSAIKAEEKGRRRAKKRVELPRD